MDKRAALKGVKVLEWTQAGNGPWTGRCFADFGAEVVKIESTRFPDFMRTSGPYKDDIPHPDRAFRFSQFNTGKKSLTLNMKNKRGIELFKKLVLWSDIVLHNQRPGLMKKMGLGYEDLKKIKDNIIFLEVSIVGQDGPHAGVGGFGNNSMAQSGQFYYYRQSGNDPPLMPGFTATPDVVAPIFAAMSGLIALSHRNKTGKGQHIDVSQLEVMAHFSGSAILDYVVNKRINEPVGNRSSYAAPHNVYPCKGEDKWCAIAVFNDLQWASLCKIIGKPELIGSPGFATLNDRKENEDNVDAVLRNWTMKHTPQEIMKVLQEFGIPAGVVQNAEDVVDTDPQIKSRNLFPRCQHQVMGEFMHARWPFILSETPDEIKATPCLGEHNWYVCSEILGITSEEFVSLIDEDIIV